MNHEVICKVCGYVGKPKTQMKGSTLIGLLLLFLFVIPWLVYDLWRQSTKKDVCAKCKSPEIIPVDTPEGQKLLNIGKK